MASFETNYQDVPPEDREYVEKLAKLQNMHTQIHNLRTLLPERLLRPARAAVQNPARNSPAKMAADLHSTAVQGSKDVRKFAIDFRSEQMQQLWQTTSSTEFPQGSDAWTVDYQSLLLQQQQQTTSTAGALPLPSSLLSSPPLTEDVKQAPQTNGEQSAERKEDVDAIIKAFRETVDKSVVIESEGTNATFPLDVTVGGELTFRITAHDQQQEEAKTKSDNDEESKKFYRIGKHPDKSSSLSNNIIEAINERGGPPQTKLEPLLSMLSAYKDLKFRPCDKCQSIFDNDVTYPVIRERNPQAKKDDPSSYWSALHRDCVRQIG